MRLYQLFLILLLSFTFYDRYVLFSCIVFMGVHNTYDEYWQHAAQRLAQLNRDFMLMIIYCYIFLKTTSSMRVAPIALTPSISGRDIFARVVGTGTLPMIFDCIDFSLRRLRLVYSYLLTKNLSFPDCIFLRS